MTSRPVRLFIAESGIQVDEQVVDLMTGEHYQSEFTKVNPNRQVPVLEDGDWRLTESSAILKYLAEKTNSGLLDFATLGDQTDDEVIQHLTQVKGVGVWTAHMFLMFTLRRPDILPTGDYGIQAAIKKYYRKRKMPKPKDMEKIAKPWVPYRSVACWYLWRSLHIKTM